MTCRSTYARAPVTFVAGEGCELIDRSVSAISTASPASPSARSVMPIRRSQTRLRPGARSYTPESLLSQPAGELARQLVARSGMRGVFFCNSGTEANEAAIKFARKRAYRRNEHCRTNPRVQVRSTDDVGSLPLPPTRRIAKASVRYPGFEFTPFNESPRCSKDRRRIAALIVEPVQGESGIHVAKRRFSRRPAVSATSAAHC